MSDTEDVDWASPTDAEIDREMDQNDVKLSSVNDNLMPELSLRNLTEDEIKKAYKKFLQKLVQNYDLEALEKTSESFTVAIRQSIYESNNPRPLMIYLHRNKTLSTHVFCDRILRNEHFIAFLNKNFLFWPWDCTFDSNYNLLLWMLLNHLGHQNAAKVAAIPLENYPVLLSLTVERGSLVLQQVVNDSRHAPSVETVFGESIRIQENFTRPTKPMTNFNDRFVTEASLDAWPPKNDSYEKLSTESEEYRTVAEKFDEKLFEIKSIYRLVRKKSLKNDDETSRKEFLYHGCLRETCRQILIGGFHKNLIGLHDEKDGDGYVFTTTPERSLIYALPNLSSQDNGDRTMLVCRVQIDPSWKPKGYRTWDMHDIPIEKAPVSGPSGIHVVFSNERIRPLYLVEFRKIGRFS